MLCCFFFSPDIGIEFGLDKCAVLVLKRGVKITCERVVSRDGQVLVEVENGYKYLGGLEGANIIQKGKVKLECLRRVKLAARWKLYDRYLMRPINAWALKVVR